MPQPHHWRPHLAQGTVAWLGLALGPAGAVALWWFSADADLSAPGRATAAVAVWMACWWLTQAVPLAATALLPIVVFPILGVSTVTQAAAPYSSSLIFLFMGGFLLGLGMQRWGLHRRFALLVLGVAGARPRRLVAGMMLVSACLSMWISNTATVVMLLPIALSLLDALERDTDDAAVSVPLAGALLLGVAYAASIGGIGTLIGTPPNLVLASFVGERLGGSVSMLDWLMVGIPMVVVLLPLTYLYLTRLAYPLADADMSGVENMVRAQRAALGPLQRGEVVVLVVFVLTALGWMTRPFLAEWLGLAELNDASIAMAGALALFVLPVSPATRTFAMDWDTARQLPWEILLLFGGGLSLASALSRHAVDAWLAQPLASLAGSPLVLVLLATALLMTFLTEITSNTAVTTALLPVLAVAAGVIGVAPVPLLIAATIAATCAFMLPVATPPNAVVFSSGRVSIAQMAGTGLALNLAGAVAIALVLSALHGAGWLPGFGLAAPAAG